MLYLQTVHKADKAEEEKLSLFTFTSIKIISARCLSSSGRKISTYLVSL